MSTDVSSSGRECLGCGKTFIKKGPGHKYCHWQCANKSRAAARQTAQCTTCGATIKLGRVICDGCRATQYEGDFTSVLAAQDDEPLAQSRIKIPRGRYVYAWFAGDSALPFYVGKGVDSRAWDRHERNDGAAHWCQTVRVSCQNFRVEIVRDNLTESGATLLEAALIEFVRLCGGMLANQTEPCRKQEKLPLTLADAFDSCPIAQR